MVTAPSVFELNVGLSLSKKPLEEGTDTGGAGFLAFSAIRL